MTQNPDDTPGFPKSLVCRMADNPKLGLLVLGGAISLPLLGLLIQFLVPMWNIGRHLMRHDNPGFGLFIVIFFCILGVALGLQYSESLAIRRHRRLAENLHDEISAAGDAENTLYALYIPLLIPLLSFFFGLIILQPTELTEVYQSQKIISILLFLAGLYVFFRYSRWSPVGKPIIRITNRNVYLYPSVRVRKSIPYWKDVNPFKNRSYYRGETRVPLEALRSVGWTGGGRSDPLAIVIEADEFMVLRKNKPVFCASKVDYPYRIFRYINLTLTSPDALVSLLTGILPKNKV